MDLKAVQEAINRSEDQLLEVKLHCDRRRRNICKGHGTDHCSLLTRLQTTPIKGVRLSLEHLYWSVYVQFGGSLRTGKELPEYEAIVAKNFSQDIWPHRYVKPVYHTMDDLISRTLQWTCRLGWTVKGWSLEEMEFVDLWTSNFEQCYYTELLLWWQIESYKISGPSLFQRCFREGLCRSHLSSLDLRRQTYWCEVGCIDDQGCTAEETKYGNNTSGTGCKKFENIQFQSHGNFVQAVRIQPTFHHEEWQQVN